MSDSDSDAAPRSEFEQDWDSDADANAVPMPPAGANGSNSSNSAPPVDYAAAVAGVGASVVPEGNCVPLCDFPYESVEHLPDEMLCIICTNPSLDNVQLCAQGHSACRACADRTYEQYGDVGRKCPTCKQSWLLSMEGKWVPNRALNSLIASAQIGCKHACHGCPFKGTLGEALIMHHKVCEYVKVECPCEGCDWKGAKCKLAAHLSEVDHAHLLVPTLARQSEQLKELKQSLLTTQAAIGFNNQERKRQHEALAEKVERNNANVNRVADQVQIVIGHVNPDSDRSERSKRRDKQTAKTVAKLEGQLKESDAIAVAVAKQRDELQEKHGALEAELEAKRAELDGLVTDARAEGQMEADEIHKAQKEALQAQVAALRSEKDDHAAWLRRARESNEAQQRAMCEQNAQLARLLPGSAPRCPCNRCVERRRVSIPSKPSAGFARTSKPLPAKKPTPSTARAAAAARPYPPAKASRRTHEATPSSPAFSPVEREDGEVSDD